jgi:hypothetical protein
LTNPTLLVVDNVPYSIQAGKPSGGGRRVYLVGNAAWQLATVYLDDLRDGNSGMIVNGHIWYKEKYRILAVLT